MGFAGRTAIAQQLYSWHILPRPQRLTELYFTDYTKLPQLLRAGDTQTLTFTVHNLEHQTTTYHYKVVAISPESGAEQALASGTFMLKHDASHVSQDSIVVPALEPRGGIKVDLFYQGTTLGDDTETIQTQSIHYWAGVREATAPKDIP